MVKALLSFVAKFQYQGRLNVIFYELIKGIMKERDA